MTPELVVFTGLQATGKTTFYRLYLAATHFHVSKDAWPNARNRERRQLEVVAETLRAGRSAVVDNTNPGLAERAPLVAIARELGARAISYWFPATLAEIMERNALREGRARVPDVGLFSVAKRLVPPGPDEGFDERHEVRIGGQGFIVTASR